MPAETRNVGSGSRAKRRHDVRRSRGSRPSSRYASRIGRPARSTSIRSVSSRAGLGPTDPVVDVHRQERRHVHRLGRAPAGDSTASVENVPVPLAPRRVRHLEHERVERAGVVAAVVDGERVVEPPERTQVREEMDLPRGTPSELLGHEVADGVAERSVGPVEEVAPPEMDGRGPAGRPKRDRVERTGQRVDVDIDERQCGRELARHRVVATVTHAPAVARKRRLGGSPRRRGERGRGHGRRHRPASIAATTSRALCTPSSWKP